MKNGVRFNELSQGAVKNYCCDSNVVLDHDIMRGDDRGAARGDRAAYDPLIIAVRM